jgi:hypothetical protein
MGCGKYFGKRQIEYIEGVPYCTDCKATGMELKHTLESERDAILRGAVEEEYVEKDKWEKAYSSSSMVSVTPERVAKLPYTIPLGGMEASLFQRVLSRTIDYLLVLFVIVSLDLLFHLSLVARWIFGDLGIPEGAYQYSTLFDPQGWIILTDHSNAARKILFLVVGLLFAYRTFCFLVGQRTLGQLFMGVFLATEKGKYPTRGARLLKGVSASLGDAALVGPVLDAAAYLMTTPKVSFSDAIGGIRAVRNDEWRATAKKLLDRATVQRIEPNRPTESY